MTVALHVLKGNQLYAKFSKCEFWLRSVSFLGHIIFSEGVEGDSKKMDAVRNCPRPLIPTEIRSSLGQVGYSGRFVDGFSSITSTLTDLT